MRSQEVERGGEGLSVEPTWVSSVVSMVLEVADWRARVDKPAVSHTRLQPIS